MAHAVVPEERLGRIGAKRDWHQREALRLLEVRGAMIRELEAANYEIDWGTVSAARGARFAELLARR